MASAYGAKLTHALAAEIKDQRGARGWSQEALADEADLHRTFIGLVESGQRGISVSAASGIAEALGMKLSELLRLAEARLTV